MARFPKPPEGSRTQRYPDLGTGPVPYDDSISPEFYELEKCCVPPCSATYRSSNPKGIRDG